MGRLLALFDVCVCTFAAFSVSAATTDQNPFLPDHVAVKPLFQYARERMRDVGRRQQVTDTVTRLVADISDDLDVTESVRQLNEVINDTDNEDSIGCRLCEAAVKTLKLLFDRVDFKHVKWPFIEVCDLFTTEKGNTRYRDLCNGSVSIQGPHVAYVISASTPERICQLQNACFLNGSALAQRAPVEPVVTNARQVDETSFRRRSRDGAIVVAQITDIHIDVRYKQDTLADCGLPICCSDKYGEGDSGPYGSYNCHIPARTADLFVEKIAFHEPDFVLYSGKFVAAEPGIRQTDLRIWRDTLCSQKDDMVQCDASGSRLWDESQQEELNASVAIIDAIKTHLPGRPVFPCFGNHEMYPTNLFYKGSPDIRALTNTLTDWWTPLANFSDTQQSTMRSAAYYSAVVRPGLRLIVYNSNFMYTADWYNVLNYDNRSEARRMMGFVEQQLQYARHHSEKVILMAHHPPNAADYIVDLAYWYRQLVLQYLDVIVLQVVGHRHCDAFNLISDDDGNPASVIFLAPPVTALDTKNPSMRLYYLHPQTFQLLDYDQFYLDLRSIVPEYISRISSPTSSMPAAAVKPEIKLLYSARAEYNLTDMSAQSWSQLTDRMQRNSSLLLQHLKHYYVDARDHIVCDEDCQREHLCYLRHSTYDQYYYCINAAAQSPQPQPVSNSTNTLTVDSGLSLFTLAWTSALVISSVSAIVVGFVYMGSHYNSTHRHYQLLSTSESSTSSSLTSLETSPVECYHLL